MMGSIEIVDSKMRNRKAKAQVFSLLAESGYTLHHSMADEDGEGDSLYYIKDEGWFKNPKVHVGIYGDEVAVSSWDANGNTIAESIAKLIVSKIPIKVRLTLA